MVARRSHALRPPEKCKTGHKAIPAGQVMDGLKSVSMDF